VSEIKLISWLIFLTGNYRIGVAASPMLFDVIVQAAKMVSINIVSFSFLQLKFKVPSAYDPAGETVYDKWMKVYRNPITNEPK